MSFDFFILPALICLIEHNYCVFKDPQGHTKLDFIGFNIIALIPIVNIPFAIIAIANIIHKLMHSKLFKSIIKWLNSPLSNKPRT